MSTPQAPRITTTIKLGTRTDRDQTMEDKIDSVKNKLAAMANHDPESSYQGRISQ